MKIIVTNQQIYNFYVNVINVIQQLSTKGKRTRYLAVLQFMKDHFEENYNSIQKKLTRIREKYASVKDNGEFVYEGVGKDQTFVYTKEASEKMEAELESYMEDKKQLEVDEVYYLTVADLPHNDEGKVIISNSLLKCFSQFVLPKELVDSILYSGLVIENKSEKEQDK